MLKHKAQMELDIFSSTTTKNKKQKRNNQCGLVVIEILLWVIVPVILIVISMEITGFWVQRTRCVQKSFYKTMLQKKIIDELKLMKSGFVWNRVSGESDDDGIDILSYRWLGGKKVKDLIKVKCELPTINVLCSESEQNIDNLTMWWNGNNWNSGIN